MRSCAVLFITVLGISTSTVAVFTVPLTKSNSLKGPSNTRPAARFAADGLVTVAATNTHFVQYTTRVGIGHPPTYYDLVVDTGSSVTLCCFDTHYSLSSTSIPTGEAMNEAFGSGHFSGKEYLDQVTLAPDLVISNQSIGVVLSYDGPKDIEGILGLGPTDLTQGMMLSDKNATIPTVMNSLVSQGHIKKNVLGVYFSPPHSGNETNGALTFGGIDPSRFVGELTYVPLTKAYPANKFWGIDVTSLTYGTHAIIPTPAAGYVDTGTSLVLLAHDFFSAYLDAIPEATLNPTNGFIEIPKRSVSSMKPLHFLIAGRVLTLNVDAQLFPEDVAGKVDYRYGVVASLQATSPLGFVLGQKFIEQYYMVFDADENRVGFAQTNNAFTTS